MSKKFLDTFPTLQLKNEWRELLDLVEVRHINYTRDKSSIRVYIKSPRLIQKETIFQIEEQIEKQLFESQQLGVQIMEQFILSEQYTPEKLYTVYGKSILEEFRKFSDLEYNLLRKAKWEFVEEYQLKIQLEDTMWAKRRGKDIEDRIKKIFCERCGFDISVTLDFIPVEKTKLREQMEEQEKRAIEAVVANRFGNARKSDFTGEGLSNSYTDTTNVDTSNVEAPPWEIGGGESSVATLKQTTVTNENKKEKQQGNSQQKKETKQAPGKLNQTVFSWNETL